VNLMRYSQSWNGVTPKFPCQICGKGDWCSVSNDNESRICRRVDDGSGHHRVDKSGGEYWLYRNGTIFPALKSLPTPRSASPEVAGIDTLDSAYSSLLARLTLEPNHFENLRKRGLSSKEIHFRGYKSLPSNRIEVAHNLVTEFGEESCSKIPGFYFTKVRDQKIWSLAGGTGILIPCREIHGKIFALKIRTDSSESGSRYHYFSSRKHNGPGAICKVHVPKHTGTSSILIRITEGELKADIATALTQVLTLSIPGVSMWRSVVPVLRELNAQTVRIAFDSDADTNPIVARALTQTKTALLTEGFQVEVETWKNN